MKSSIVLLLAATAGAYVVNTGTKCFVYPESLTHGGQPVDDSPSILQAFDLCGYNGSVILGDYTYTIDQVLNTTNLVNCDVELHGQMVWSTNVPYWLTHSFSVTFQNQSTAWLFGGTNVTFRGFGKGVFDGQGQTWYNENRNGSNQFGRPISITIINSTNVYMDGLKFRQSQFWSTFISYSQNVTMTNIDVSSISNSVWNTVNTDGSDTWNSKDIVFQNWKVQNGDDCIAIKGNSTNVLVKTITCIDGNGLTIGSVGQYPETPDYVENIMFEDCIIRDAHDGAYIKTWQGDAGTKVGNGESGSGGGGGSGYVKNVTWNNVEMINVGLPIYVTQCIYGGDPSVCDSSKMQISDITWSHISGTSSTPLVSSIHCVPGHPCPGMKFIDVNMTSLNASRGLPSPPLIFQCANIVDQNATGIDATGIPCNAWAPADEPQNG